MDKNAILLKAGLVLAFTFGACALRRFPFLPLDRPAIALLGALATVGLGVLSLDGAFRAINLDVIALLLGMMLTAGALAEAGFYAHVARSLASVARDRPVRLLVLVLVASAALSALVTNDTVCVFFAPLVIESARAAGRRPMPYLLALALAANTGSAATLVGNPQNAYIGIEAATHATSRLGFLRYAALATPVALAGIAASYAALALLYRRELAAAPSIDEMEPESLESDAAFPRRSLSIPYDASLARRALAVLVLSAALLVAGLPLSLAALAGAAASIVVSGRDPRLLYARVDGALLLFFAGLFVVTEGARHAGAIDVLRGLFAPDPQASFVRQAASMTVLTTVGSQVVSNVPFVLATTPWLERLESPDAQRVLLALVSTFAGNLTLLGSVANLIVAEAARQDEPLGFWEHLRAGLPVTVVQVLVALGAVIVYVRVGLL